MKVDVTTEVATLQTWVQFQPPGPVTEATVAGFMWALALVSGQPAEQLPKVSPTPAAVPTSPPPLVGTSPGWQGLGISPIGDRTVTADPDTPLAAARAFTTGPDGMPIPAQASYAEQAETVAQVDNNGT